MAVKQDIIGLVFGRLTVVGEEVRTTGTHRSGPKQGKPRYRRFATCICKCGTPVTVSVDHLKNSHTQSCGCLKKELTIKRFTTHGMSHTPEWHSWAQMRDRCYNSNNKLYKYYGARGVVVCDRWIESFGNFYNDMGKCPPHCSSVERIDNDGNYEPSNCKWATRDEQANNKRNNRQITIDGVTKTLAQWCGGSKTAFYRRAQRRIYSLGWCDQCAISILTYGTCIHKTT